MRGRQIRSQHHDLPQHLDAFLHPAHLRLRLSHCGKYVGVLRRKSSSLVQFLLCLGYLALLSEQKTQLQMAGFKPTELATEAAVTLEPDGPQRFKISRSALTLRAQVPGISAEKFASLAREAELNCPVSKVLKAEITLDAKLG